MTKKLRCQLTEIADQDIADILRESERLFGPRQRAAYAKVIEKTVAIIAEQPERPSVRLRNDIGVGIRSLHLELAAGRRGGAAHCLYFTHGRLEDGATGIIILRVLHERMEPRAHLVDPEG